jgi:hypothetical protein
VSHAKPLLLEDWTLTISACNDEVTQFSFSVEGSKTGPDGKGSNKEKFVSTSGRVVIEPADWWVTNARQWAGAKMPPDFKVRWTVKPLFVDSAQLPGEDVLTVAQGLPNGKHTIEISGTAPLRSIRVHRPPSK